MEKRAIYFLSQLNEYDMEWMLTTGYVENVVAGTTIFSPEKSTKYIAITLSGKINVTAKHSDKIITLSDGEILGEISFINELLPTRYVVAATDVELFCLEHEKIREKIKRDIGFSSRFYNIISNFLAERLYNVIQDPYAKSYDLLMQIDKSLLATAVSRFNRLIKALRRKFDKINITGNDLTLRDIMRASETNVSIEINTRAADNVKKSREMISYVLNNNVPVYGVTRRLGALKELIIEHGDQQFFQHSIITSHAVGIGEHFDTSTVRAVLIAQINNLASYSQMLCMTKFFHSGGVPLVN